MVSNKGFLLIETSLGLDSSFQHEIWSWLKCHLVNKTSGVFFPTDLLQGIPSSPPGGIVVFDICWWLGCTLDAVSSEWECYTIPGKMIQSPLLDEELSIVSFCRINQQIIVKCHKVCIYKVYNIYILFYFLFFSF